MTLIDGCVLVGTTDNRLKAKRTTVPIMNGEEPNLLSAFSYPAHPLADSVTDDDIENPVDSDQKLDEPSTANESDDLKNNLENEDGRSLRKESNGEGIILSDSVDSHLNNKKFVTACKNVVIDICSKMKQIKESMSHQTNPEENHISRESENSLNCITDKTIGTDVPCSNTCTNKTVENSCGRRLKLNGASDVPSSEVESSSSKCGESSIDSNSPKEKVGNKSNNDISISLIEMQNDTISDSSFNAKTQVSDKINTLNSHCPLKTKQVVQSDQINTCANGADVSNDDVLTKSPNTVVEEPTTQSAESDALVELSFESASEEMTLQVEEDELLETDFQSKIMTNGPSEGTCASEIRDSEDPEGLKVHEVESIENDEKHLSCCDASVPVKSQNSVTVPEKIVSQQSNVTETKPAGPADSEELSFCDKVSTETNIKLSNTREEQCSTECSSVSSSCTTAAEQSNDVLGTSDKDDDSLVSSSSSNKSKFKETDQETQSVMLEDKGLGAMQESTVAPSTSESKSKEVFNSPAISENDNISPLVSTVNPKSNVSIVENVDGATESDDLSKSCSDEINTETHLMENSLKEGCHSNDENDEFKRLNSNDESKEKSPSHLQKSDDEINTKCSSSSDDLRSSDDLKKIVSDENSQCNEELNDSRVSASTDTDTELSSTSTGCPDNKNQTINRGSMVKEVLNKMEMKLMSDDSLAPGENAEASSCSFADQEEPMIVTEKSGSVISLLDTEEGSNVASADASGMKPSVENLEPSIIEGEDSKTELLSTQSNLTLVCPMGKDKQENNTKLKVDETEESKEGDTNNFRKKDGVFQCDEITSNEKIKASNKSKDDEELESNFMKRSQSSKDESGVILCDEKITLNDQTEAVDRSKNDAEAVINCIERSQNKSEDIISEKQVVKEDDQSEEAEKDSQSQNSKSKKESHKEHTSNASPQEMNIDQSFDKISCQEETETKETQDSINVTDLKNSVSVDVVESLKEDNQDSQESAEDICSEELILDDTFPEKEIFENDSEENENCLLSDSPDSNPDSPSSSPDTPDTSQSDDQNEESEETQEDDNDSSFGHLTVEELVSMPDDSEKGDGKEDLSKHVLKETFKESASDSVSDKTEDHMEEISEVSNTNDDTTKISKKLTCIEESDDQCSDDKEVTKNEISEGKNSSKDACVIFTKEEEVKTSIIPDSESEESSSIDDVSRKVLDSIIDLISNDFKEKLKNDSLEEMQSVFSNECESKELSESVSSSTNDKILHYDHLYSASPQSNTSEKIGNNAPSLKRSASDAVEEEEDEASNKRPRSDEDSLPPSKRKISENSDSASDVDYKKMKILTDDEDSSQSSDEGDSSDSENYSIADTVRATYDSDDMRENSDSCSSFDFPQSSSVSMDDDEVVKKFNRFQVSLRNFSREDLEEIIVLKMLETMKYKGIAGEQQKQLVNLQEQCAAQKKLLTSIKKQYSETSIIMKKFIEHSEAQQKKNFTIPMKATRSVGLQVALADSPSHSSKADFASSGTKKNSPLSKPRSSLLTAKLKTPASPVASNQQDSTIKTKPASTVIPPPSPPKTIPTVKVLTPVSRPPSLPQILTQSKSPVQSTSQIITTLAQKPVALRTKGSNLEVIDLVDDSQQQGRTIGTIQNIQNKGMLPPNSVGQVQQLSYVVTTSGQPLLLSPPINQGTRMLNPTGNNRGVLGTPIKNGQIFQLQNKTGVLSGNQFHLVTSAAQLKQVIRPVVHVNPTTNKAPQIKHVPRILRPVHPAPLPTIPVQAFNPSWKMRPPKPTLRIGKNGSGITLSWTLNGYDKDKYAEIVSYQLFAYQEGTEPPSTDLWKKVGDVKALPLPMACTLTKFVSGHRYHFAVQAVDIHSRVGEYSTPDSIMLN